MSRSKTNEVPKISIGMPVYNGERFIREAIDSLLAQTFTDFELTISDNASTDDTEAICRDCAKQDERVRYIRQEVNLGVEANLKIVLDEAVGDYFMWAAADDYWSSNWLEVLLGDFTPGTAIAFGHVWSIDESGNLVERYNYRGFSKVPLICSIQLFLREEMYYKANYSYGLYERQNLLKFTFLQTYGADNLFVFEVIQNSRILTNPNAIIFKRFVATSEGALATEASSGFIRKLLLLDLLPNYAMYPKLAQGNSLKIILLMLLPLKYFKSLCFMTYRHIRSRVMRAKLRQ